MANVNIHKGLDRCATKLVLAVLAAMLGVFGLTGLSVAAPVGTPAPQGSVVGGPRADVSDPALGGRAVGAASPVVAAVTAGDRRAVKRAIERAFRSGDVTREDRDRYVQSYASALSLLARLGGQRKVELGYVLGTVARLARAKRLSGDRMRPVFLIVDRNREWWAKAGPPATGARLRFGASRLIFQYYPGHGLQLQPLANFGQANGYWAAHRDDDLRALLSELVDLRVKRSGFTTWEYYFDFGGGSPPWISAMTQATAMQALARGSSRLADPGLLEIARQARGAFERSTPVGVRSPAGRGGAWYALYSFAPHLNVLNGMLQSLIGLDAYVSYSNDTRGATLFSEGDRVARAAIGAFDTGAWSLYNRPSGKPGHEADLNYHRLNRDFARRLCNITKTRSYCDAADDFTRYLREPPDLGPFGPAPAPAQGGRDVRFYFNLSKVGRVGITVQDAPSEPAPASARARDARPSASARARAARTYLSTSAPFARGKHFFRWVPPRLAKEHTYRYTLSARDLAGNSHSESGTLRVKARS
jgi:hypothetical protein